MTSVILNVDDQAPGRYAKRRALEQAGYVVFDAATGTEALHLVAQSPPALVLLDVWLPDINGIDVCKRIKRDHPGTMVLQISATMNTSAARVKSLQSGADSYITQPVEPEEIVAAVQALLRIRAAEQAVRDSELRFRTLVEVTPQAVWLGTASGAITYWNPYWYAFTGLAPVQTEGDGWLQAVHPDQRDHVTAVHRAALACGEAYAVEMQLRHAPDGAWHWFTARGHPVRAEDGTVLQWVGNALEIDTLKREGQESALLGAIVSSTSDAVVSFAADGARIITWNDAAESLFGYTADEAIGQPISILLSEGQDAEAHDMFVRALAGARVEIETVRRARNGEMIDVSITAARIRAPDGTLIGVSTIKRDIRERRRAEATLRSLNEKLEAKVAERTHELTAANERLRREAIERERAEEALRQAQKLEALGQLAGGIAHDVNNTLQAVLGGARLIIKRAGDRESVEKLAQMVLEAAERGAGVVRRLLAFARRDSLHAERVDPATLLAEVAEMLAPSLGPQIAVEVAAGPDLPAIQVDRGQLSTVLVNLAVNGRDALAGRMDPVLRLEASSDLLDPVTEPIGGREDLPAGRYLRLVVVDNGIGMPASILGRITEPFFTTKPHGKGTGLGLPMAKGFAEQSGGAMTIDSAPGYGTRVTLWLPEAVENAVRVGRPPPAPVPATSHAHARVLLVDDEALVRATLAAALRGAGLEVLEAEDAGAALRKLAGTVERPDVLVTDLTMPGRTGADLIRDARHLHPGLPAMLMTGFVGAIAVETIGDVGDGPFSLLHKPVDPDQFSDVVMSLLGAAAVPPG